MFTPEEIANELVLIKRNSGIDLNKALKYVDKVILSQKTVNVRSLEDTVGPEGEVRVGNFIEDKNAENAEMKLIEAELTKKVEKLLSIFKERDADILRLRFGLGSDQEEHTFKEIGDKYGLSSKRIRQLEAEALKRLRRLYEKEVKELL